MIGSHKILGMRLDWAQKTDMYEVILSHARNYDSAYCCIPNVHQCIEAYEKPEFRKIVNDADLVFSDSYILEKARSWAYGVLKHDIPRGAEIMIDLCRLSEQRHVKVGFFGSSEKTLDKLVANINRDFPNLDISYAYSPPYRDLTLEEDEAIRTAINESGTQLLFVGLGCPKQELWMGKQKGKIMASMIGIGAAFDFNAGIVKPSPPFIHRNGLEWLWRLSMEPRRLWKRYLKTSPKFLILLLRQKLFLSMNND